MIDEVCMLIDGCDGAEVRMRSCNIYDIRTHLHTPPSPSTGSACPPPHSHPSNLPTHLINLILPPPLLTYTSTRSGALRVIRRTNSLTRRPLHTRRTPRPPLPPTLSVLRARTPRSTSWGARAGRRRSTGRRNTRRRNTRRHLATRRRRPRRRPSSST